MVYIVTVKCALIRSAINYNSVITFNQQSSEVTASDKFVAAGNKMSHFQKQKKSNFIKPSSVIKYVFFP